MELLASVPPELIVFGLVFAILAKMIFAKPARRRIKRWRYHNVSRHRPKVVPQRASDPVSQIQAVMTGEFKAKAVLSRTEAKVMAATEAAIAEAGLPWRVLAQVALGEVLASDNEAAFRAINAKRVDLLIVSARRMPLAAIEYQGEGHWQGSAPVRDAVKKEALRRAGVAYVEVTPSHRPDDIRREIARLAATLEADWGRSVAVAPPKLSNSPADGWVERLTRS